MSYCHQNFLSRTTLLSIKVKFRFTGCKAGSKLMAMAMAVAMAVASMHDDQAVAVALAANSDKAHDLKFCMVVD